MKNLNDEQYNALKEYADKLGIKLYGYQKIDNGILLINSQKNVFGKNVEELKSELSKIIINYKHL